MRPYLYLPFVREALEKAFEDDPSISVYSTSSYLVAKGGGHRFKVLVRAAPGGTFSGHLVVHNLSRGYGLFLVHPDLLEGLLVLYTKPLPFSRTPDVLTWETLKLAAVSKVHLPFYALEGLEGGEGS
jgi:hypothetical protein